jgi:hypothetical protein
VKVDGEEKKSPIHKVDCYKNKIALELEWNNKDPFFDRDLNNFRLLFDLRASAATSGRSAKTATRYVPRSSRRLPVSRWHEQIGDPTLADGILDRLVHNAHRIEMRGDSMRKNRGKPNAM